MLKHMWKRIRTTEMENIFIQNFKSGKSTKREKRKFSFTPECQLVNVKEMRVVKSLFGDFSGDH